MTKTAMTRMTIRSAQTLMLVIAAMLMVCASDTFAARKSTSQTNKGRISYTKNGRIHVSIPGQPDGEPIIKCREGHHDFKPSWSKKGWLVFFRRVKNDPDTLKWKTDLYIAGYNGKGLRKLADGDTANFNPTWTRDGSHMPIWSRKDKAHKWTTYNIMTTTINGSPGTEYPLTASRYHSWAYSCLKDGRILVNSTHDGPLQYYLMTPGDNKKNPNPTFELIKCDLASKGFLARITLTPDEKKVCFEFSPHSNKSKDTGRILYHGKFDKTERVMYDLVPFANHKPTLDYAWFAYPRWLEGSNRIAFHANSTGKGRLFIYDLKTKETKQISTDETADYRYPHGEMMPK